MFQSARQPCEPVQCTQHVPLQTEDSVYSFTGGHCCSSGPPVATSLVPARQPPVRTKVHDRGFGHRHDTVMTQGVATQAAVTEKQALAKPCAPSGVVAGAASPGDGGPSHANASGEQAQLPLAPCSDPPGGRFTGAWLPDVGQAARQGSQARLRGLPPCEWMSLGGCLSTNRCLPVR